VSDKKAIVVSVDNVTKSFKIPLEGSNGLKQKIINHLKGRKGYREFTPLQDVSFKVYEGDFFGIVGRNGSGKSTLLKTIAGIYSPQHGNVHVAGSLIPFIELGVGFNPELSGRENVFLNGALLGFSHKEIVEMYNEIVDFAELHDFMEERLKNYSSGMQVRLAFSIAIKAQGDVLLLDEVLAVGDAAFQQKCFDYFDQLRKEKKKTVIIVTHDMSAVQRFCNRAMIINQGSIKIIGKPSEVANEYQQENIAISEKGTAKDSSVLNISLLDTESGIDIIFNIKASAPYNDYYIGLTLLMNGMNLGEINSSQIDGEKSMTYHLNTTNLNPGKYEVSAALFRKGDRSLLAVSNTRPSFLVKGFDEVRGSGMKLESKWTAN